MVKEIIELLDEDPALVIICNRDKEDGVVRSIGIMIILDGKLLRGIDEFKFKISSDKPFPEIEIKTSILPMHVEG